jgi:TolA-binding protein
MRLPNFITALLAATMLAGPAMTQSAGAQSAGIIDLRVGKLEKEMKAVQRTVFPNGAPLQPELGTTGAGVTTGSPASSLISDLTTRVDSLEKGLASLTGQSEHTDHRLKLAEDAVKRMEARLSAVEGGTAAPAASSPAATLVTPKPVPVTRPPLATPGKSTPPVKTDPARKAAVAAIELPDTGDAAEDAYSYAFRLYSARFYPEAVLKLKEFAVKYPAHKRASYAQNLLGRAYYDDGKPALASVALYDNYQKNPKGDRASESLYWLGQALTRLKKLPDACKVYDELRDVYGVRLSADLKARAAKGRADAKCAA